MFNSKKGDMIFADIFSIFLTVLLLVGYIIFFLTSNFMDAKQEEIEIKESIYGRENIFVLKAFLDTPADEGMGSDIVNFWLDDPNSYEARLVSFSEGIFSEIYGDCYSLTFGNSLELGGSDFHDNKGICIDYPNFNNGFIEICLDISDYDEKLGKGEGEKCF